MREDGGEILDPYALLDPVFLDRELQAAVALTEEERNGQAEGFIASGGAVIIAYDQLQRRDLPAAERERIERELKTYCELDTLAMVMVYQGLTRKE